MPRIRGWLLVGLRWKTVLLYHIVYSARCIECQRGKRRVLTKGKGRKGRTKEGKGWERKEQEGKRELRLPLSCESCRRHWSTTNDLFRVVTRKLPINHSVDRSELSLISQSNLCACTPTSSRAPAINKIR